MSRRQRRMIRRARGQAMLRGVLLLSTAAVLLAGLVSHMPGEGRFQADTVAQPTATPVSAAFDETTENREVLLPAETWYAIQTGVYSSREAAQSRVNAYADRGAPGYVTEDSGKWRVFIACYGEKNDALRVQDRLESMQKVETHLHVWALPAVTMRLSGMRGQLDVAQAGVYLPGQTAVLLRDAAMALDAGEISVESATQRIASLGESIALWAKTARERFPTPYPVIIGEVLDFAEAWSARQSLLLRAGNATDASALLKQCAMAIYDEDAAIRRTLLQQ